MPTNTDYHVSMIGIHRDWIRTIPSRAHRAFDGSLIYCSLVDHLAIPRRRLMIQFTWHRTTDVFTDAFYGIGSMLHDDVERMQGGWKPTSDIDGSLHSYHDALDSATMQIDAKSIADIQELIPNIAVDHRHAWKPTYGTEKPWQAAHIRALLQERKLSRTRGERTILSKRIWRETRKAIRTFRTEMTESMLRRFEGLDRTPSSTNHLKHADAQRELGQRNVQTFSINYVTLIKSRCHGTLTDFEQFQYPRSKSSFKRSGNLQTVDAVINMGLYWRWSNMDRHYYINACLMHTLQWSIEARLKMNVMW